MKLLILSTATGQGHNSAAAAIAEDLISQGCEAVISDILSEGKKDISAPVSKLYSDITVNTPRFFKFLYRAGETISSSNRHSPIFRLNSLKAEDLYSTICESEPDVIVCPHIFSAQVITYIREKYGLKTPTVGIATDYTCIPFWEESRLDSYVIPSPLLIDEFAKKGIPSDKLVPLGIPVSARFRTSLPKFEARDKLGFTADHVFIVMGGSMGFGNIAGLTQALLDKVPNTQVAAVCGNNKKEFKKLCGIKNVFPFEYIDNVDMLMDAADAVLTKPGGLSSTEALVKRIPVILTKPIPGCERHNAEYLSSIGVAETASSVLEAAEKAQLLVTNISIAANMLDAQNKHIPKDADRLIGNYLIGLGKTRKKEM